MSFTCHFEEQRDEKSFPATPGETLLIEYRNGQVETPMTRMYDIIKFSVFFAAIFLMASCQRDDVSPNHSAGTPTQPQYSGKLIITGSSTMSPMVSAIAERFERLYPAVQIEVQAGGSVRGINDVREGVSDIGMVSRSLGDKEIDLQGFPMARDGVCLVVNKNNPIETLSAKQVAEIYTGSVTNWKEVGGRERPITVFSRREGLPVLELFTHYFKIKHADIKAEVVMGDNPEAVKSVADNPDGIVPISVGLAERNAAAGAPIKLLSLDGVIATSRNVRTGNFPISRTLTLVTKEQPTGLSGAFIDFCLSSQVSDLVRTYDFVP